MIRLLLLGSLVLIFAMAFQNRWIEVHWDRFFNDMNLPFMADPEPARKFTFDGQGK